MSERLTGFIFVARLLGIQAKFQVRHQWVVNYDFRRFLSGGNLPLLLLFVAVATRTPKDSVVIIINSRAIKQTNITTGVPSLKSFTVKHCAGEDCQWDDLELIVTMTATKVELRLADVMLVMAVIMRDRRGTLSIFTITRPCWGLGLGCNTKFQHKWLLFILTDLETFDPNRPGSQHFYATSTTSSTY